MNVGLAHTSSNISNFGWFGLNCPADYKVNPNSVPDYDVWGPDGCNWSATDWINWHKAMVKEFGKDDADNRWAAAYDKSSYGSKEISYSTGNNDFKAYAIAQGLNNKSTILTKVYKAESALNAVGEPVRNIGTAITNATSATAQLGKSAETVARWLPYILLAALLLVAFLVWNKQTLNVL